MDSRLVPAVLGAAALACGAGSSGGPADPSGPGGPGGAAALTLTAGPDPVSTGASLTYTLKTAPGGAAPGSVVVHLPAGVADIRPSGAGWACGQATAEADAQQPVAHVDVSCSSAVMGLARPALEIEVKAPAAPGNIRACAEARMKASGGPACVTSTVE